MEEPGRFPPNIALPGPNWSDRRWVLILLAATLALRLFQIANTELTTRDSIAYIRGAWRMDHEPWGEVIKGEAHHPGYAFTVWLASKPTRLVIPELPRAMQRSAQFASALASVLLAVAMFYLGKGLFDSRVGFWASLLFQVLPASGRLMPDGLSEPLFLLWVTLALVCAVRALNGGHFAWFALTGLLTGLAYLTRTEGLLIVPVLLVVLVGLQWSPRWRRSRGTLCRDGLMASTACAIIVLPFMIHIGGISLKTSYKDMMRPEGWQQPTHANPGPRAHAVTSPMPLAMWNIGPDVTPSDRVGWAGRALAMTLNKAFFHVLTGPAIVGVWLYRRRVYEIPGMWILFLSGIILTLLLWRLGQSAGYLGERHVMLIVLGGMYFAVAALGALGGWLVRGRHARVSLLLLVAITCLCLPKLLGRLHGHRTGFREAGAWLAENTLPGDDVFDPLAWAGYHSGRLFVRQGATRSEPRVCYVVLERSDNPHPHLWYLTELAEKLAATGEAVHRVPLRRGKSGEELVVYRVPRPKWNDPEGIALDTWLAANMRR